MLVVHALVHEARHQQRHADDQVPDEAEALHRALLDVRQLVDERCRRGRARGSRQARPASASGVERSDHRREQRRIAEQRRAEHVGPVDRRTRHVEVARQVRRGLEHRRVVLGARRRALRAGSVGALRSRIAVSVISLCGGAPLPGDSGAIVAFVRLHWRSNARRAASQRAMSSRPSPSARSRPRRTARPSSTSPGRSTRTIPPGSRRSRTRSTA